ncbi:MAG TPA: O-acetylhomoserine aminocarboxypropyltransferase/cysteine synthase [Desulfobulbus sp.]|nr:O-acetylhomoserine aminocarboxypropyltransferase/cysteine synthase [Desulfobulbus sp.]
MKGFTTRAIHGGLAGPEAHGALRTPVYDTVAYEHDTAHSLQLAFEGRKPAHVYSRITNPTVQDLEQKLRLLSGGMAVLAVSSGMAAISNTVLALAGAGANIVTSRHLFGNTISLFEKTLAPWGLEVRYVDMTDPDAVEQAVDDSTRAIYLESITNPQLEVADCSLVARIGAGRNVPLIVDNTLMTPYLFDTAGAGVAVEVLSSTKYISGGATCLGGIIIDNGTFDWRHAPRLAERAGRIGPMAFIGSLRQEVYRDTGACLAPHNAYLQSLGLETMGLRIERSCANALRIARYLSGHAKVCSVNYPGLPESPFHATARRQFGDRFGGILTFDLADRQACFDLMDRLRVIRRATNINDNKTLILHPHSTIFAEYADEEKEAMGVRPTMLRLSAGIEDHDDILADLEEALKTP